MKMFRKLSIVTATLFACTSADKQSPVVDTVSIKPGTEVFAGGQKVELYDGTGQLAVGKPITGLLKEIGADALIEGKVAVINVVPSIDTPVCEEQSHLLGETKELRGEIARLSISRDLPMATKRFAKEAGLENIAYASDYKSGSFGKKSGLMMKGNELLARGVIVTDRKGIIRHLQIVPDVTHLPDMNAAFKVANDLAAVQER